MYYYRLYYLDHNDHHIVDVQDFRAGSDALAIKQAGEARHGELRELWNGDRRVLELSK
jgi:hypothetical protein